METTSPYHESSLKTHSFANTKIVSPSKTIPVFLKYPTNYLLTRNFVPDSENSEFHDSERHLKSIEIQEVAE